MRQTVLTIILVSALAATGFVWWRNFRTGPVPLASLPESAEQDDRFRLYRAIQSVAPDFSLFSDPLFKSLRSVEKTATTTVRAGRLNPFQPF